MEKIGLRFIINSTHCSYLSWCVLVFIIMTSSFNTRPTIAINLSLSGFHPGKMLSSSSSSSSSSSPPTGSFGDSRSSLLSSDSSQTSISSSANSMEGISRDPLREDEVMYHLYRNGRTKGEYQKASTTFMVNLFNKLQTGQSWTTGRYSKAVTDTIRSFSGKNSSKTQKGRQLISFFVPYLPRHERLKSAEIRFLRKPHIKARSRRFKIRVDVHKNAKLIKRFILRERSVAQYGYDVFDVTRILRPWVNGYHGNVSLHVKVSKKLESHTQVALQDTPLQSTSLIVLYLEDSQFLKNMYTSYTADETEQTINDVQSTSSKSLKDTKRYRRSLPFTDPVFSDILSNSLDSSDESVEGVTNNRSKRDNNKQRKRRNRKNRKWHRAGKREKCQMYDFDVDFSAIGWGQWIIHPKRFNARFCFGVCPSPIDSKFQPTNHAMLQTLMKMKKPNIAPSPCCVPTKLNSVSMLYFEYDEIVVRHHEDMIASECGCR